MTDQQPTDATPKPEPGEPSAATAPPTFSAPQPPNQAPWTPGPATAPVAASSPASGPPFRPSVAVVGVIALLAVIGTIVWGGGSIDRVGVSQPNASGSAPAVPGSAGPTGGGGPGIPGSAGSSGTSGGGVRPQIPNMPFDANVLGPSGGSVAPTEYGAVLEWHLPGNWMDKITEYQTSFPMIGYQLADKFRVSVPDSDSGEPIAYVYEVIPVGGAYSDHVGYLKFMQDPDDPAGSTYLIWSTEL